MSWLPTTSWKISPTNNVVNSIRSNKELRKTTNLDDGIKAPEKRRMLPKIGISKIPGLDEAGICQVSDRLTDIVEDNDQDETVTYQTMEMVPEVQISWASLVWWLGSSIKQVHMFIESCNIPLKD